MTFWKLCPPLDLSAASGRTELSAGWNPSSPQQDIAWGRQASLEAGGLTMLKDSRVDSYLEDLGQRLSKKVRGFPFPYIYKAVNDLAVNAFSLPGGLVYINRGVIEMADDEGQLAGVVAHEIAHVALRHATRPVPGVPPTAECLLFCNTDAALARVGMALVSNPSFQKPWNGAETQADLMATQILSDVGYDPRAWMRFLQRMHARNLRAIDRASGYPDSQRRIDDVREELVKLGERPVTAPHTAKQFDRMKRYLRELPVPPSERTG